MVLKNLREACPQFFGNLQEQGAGKAIGEKGADIAVLIIPLPNSGFQAKRPHVVERLSGQQIVHKHGFRFGGKVLGFYSCNI